MLSLYSAALDGFIKSNEFRFVVQVPIAGQVAGQTNVTEKDAVTLHDTLGVSVLGFPCGGFENMELKY